VVLLALAYLYMFVGLGSAAWARLHPRRAAPPAP
jgi:hypothetical protein